MKKNIYLAIYLILYILGTNNLYGEGTWLQHIKVPALLNKYRRTLAVTSKYLWIGTNGKGLQRYDGKEFKIYNKKNTTAGSKEKKTLKNGAVLILYNKKNINHGLLSDYIRCILVDKKRRGIWIGTGSGLNFLKIDPKTKKDFWRGFTKKNGIISENIKTMDMDINGNLWIGTLKGLSFFNGKTFSNFTKKEGLIEDYISSIKCFGNTVWIIYRTGKISRYKNEKWTHFPIPTDK